MPPQESLAHSTGDTLFYTLQECGAHSIPVSMVIGTTMPRLA